MDEREAKRGEKREVKNERAIQIGDNEIPVHAQRRTLSVFTPTSLEALYTHT